MEAEDWPLIKAASFEANRSLETIERMLGNFEETISVACALMLWDLISYDQVSMAFGPFSFD